MMGGFFEAGYDNPFIAYSSSHRVVLAIFAASVILLYVFRCWFRKGERRRNGRFVLAFLLVLCELMLYVWYARTGIFRFQDSLPLDLCSISLYMCVVMLLLNSEKVFRIVYFTGIGGAIQALLTPALVYGYPHFRFMHFFVAHIVIILAVLYMVWVERFRPTLKSVAVTMVFLNVLAVFVGIVNWLTGGNYMFLARKPETASLLDVLGPHPWYILSMEIAALLVFLLLYLPFAFSRRNRRHEEKKTTTY